MKRRFKAVVIISIISLFIIFFACFYATHNFKIVKNIVDEVVVGTEFDTPLIMAVIRAESNFDIAAVSSKNAKGLMQIKDETFSFVCEKYSLTDLDEDDIFDPSINVRVGVLYLKYLKEKFGDTTTALCAYNAGEGVVAEWLKDTRYSSDKKTLIYIPYDETRSYIKKIRFYFKVYGAL